MSEHLTKNRWQVVNAHTQKVTVQSIKKYLHTYEGFKHIYAHLVFKAKEYICVLVFDTLHSSF